MNHFFIFVLCAFPILLHAQNNMISGEIINKNQLLPYVPIELKSLSPASYPQHTWTDSLGHFQFEALQEGKYLIKISYLGFKEFLGDTIHINAEQKEYVQNVILEESSEMLQEVVITDKNQILETDKGKLIFNVQNSAITTGQTALDILKKLPGITVGQNDEILFRGGAGINVMVDGKMTYLTGTQLANYLKGISAEDLNKIELITTPPAEFDAEGNAGLIHIISKKSLKKGYAIDVRSSLSYGKFWMTNQNISASLRTRKLSLYGSFDYNTPHRNWYNKSGNTINDNGDQLRLEKNYELTYKIKYYTWKAGADWQFLPKHKIGIDYHGYLDDFKSYNNTELNRINNSDNLHSFLHSGNNIREPYYYDAINLNYKFDIDSLGKKITADAHYTSYRNFSDGLMITRNYTADGDFLNEYQQRSHQPGFIKIASVKVDADLPFKKFSIKTGIKYAGIENDNQYRFDSLHYGNFVEIEEMSDHFKYKERIAAAYISAAKNLGKTSVEAGLRMEHTYADGYTAKHDIANKWAYTKLFPSLAIRQMINEDSKVDLSLSRRINRPSYSDLNPVRWYYDPYFYYSGNPQLIPELAWVSSLTYSLWNRYIFSASYNQSFNYISRRLIVDDNGVSIKSQSDNFGKRHRFDFTVSIPFEPLSFWSILFFSDISYTSYSISQMQGEKILKQWATIVSLQQDFALPNGFTINIAAYFFSSELRGIYMTRPTGYIDFGIKKAFLNKRLVAQLSISDICNTNRYKAFSQSDITDYYYNDKPYNRIIGLSLKYHFGGALVKSSPNKTEEQERL